MGWPVEVDVEVRVNGQTRQKSNTRMFIFKLPELIAYITKYMTLEPGDLFVTMGAGDNWRVGRMLAARLGERAE